MNNIIIHKNYLKNYHCTVSVIIELEAKYSTKTGKIPNILNIL